jgi:hypothetical protein
LQICKIQTLRRFGFNTENGEALKIQMDLF